MKKPAKNILSLPINTLPLSLEFKAMAKENSFFSLSELVELPIDVLLKHPLFDQRMLFEYLDFLEKNGLEDLIEG